MSAKDCVVKMPSWELLLSSGGFFFSLFCNIATFGLLKRKDDVV